MRLDPIGLHAGGDFLSARDSKRSLTRLTSWVD